MHASDRTHARRIAELENILDRELKEIEREQDRPFWLYPVIAFASIIAIMVFIDGAMWASGHPIF